MQHHTESKTLILHDIALVDAVIAAIGKAKYRAKGRCQERQCPMHGTPKHATHVILHCDGTTLCKWDSYHEENQKLWEWYSAANGWENGNSCLDFEVLGGGGSSKLVLMLWLYGAAFSEGTPLSGMNRLCWEESFGVIPCSKFRANKWDNGNNSLDLEILGNEEGRQ
jgi:hypothetical protein